MAGPLNGYDSDSGEVFGVGGDFEYSSDGAGSARGWDSDDAGDMIEVDGNDFIAALNAMRQQAEADDPMPSWMRTIVQSVFNLIDVTNVGLGAALSLVGWGICLLGAGSMAYTCFSLPMSMYNSSGFSLLYSELMESAAIPTLVVGIVLTIVGRDFASGQKMLQGIASTIPYMLTGMIFGGGDYYGGYRRGDLSF